MIRENYFSYELGVPCRGDKKCYMLVLSKGCVVCSKVKVIVANLRHERSFRRFLKLLLFHQSTQESPYARRP